MIFVEFLCLCENSFIFKGNFYEVDSICVGLSRTNSNKLMVSGLKALNRSCNLHTILGKLLRV